MKENTPPTPSAKESVVYDVSITIIFVRRFLRIVEAARHYHTTGTLELLPGERPDDASHNLLRAALGDVKPPSGFRLRSADIRLERRPE